MNRSNLWRMAQWSLVAAGLVGATGLQAQFATNWVAFNDHNRGTATGTKVSAYSVAGTGTAVGGPLTNVSTGTMLPVGLAVHADGGFASWNATSGVPNDGSPAARIFGTNGYGQIDWSASSIQMGNASPWTADVTFTFTNLTPGAMYVFRGTGMRGGGYLHRWALATLSNATSFVPAHQTGPGSPGIITNGWGAYGSMLTARQAALDSGANLCGDVIGWDMIVPNGTSFSVICSNYLSVSTTDPGGTVDSTYAYAFSAVMLAELLGRPTLTQQPQDTTVLQLTPASFTVAGIGANAQQWFKAPLNAPTLLDGETNATLTLAHANLGDAGGYFAVLANAAGSVTSRVAQLTISPDTTPPALLTCVGTPDLSQNPPGSVYLFTVTYSKPINMESAAGPDSLNAYILYTPDMTALFIPTEVLSNSPTTVTLKTANPFADVGYTNFLLIAQGSMSGLMPIQDLAGNLLPEPINLPVFWRLPLIPAPQYDTVLWDYFEYPTNQFMAPPPQASQPWQTYADTGIPWMQGQQMFSGATQSPPDSGSTADFGVGTVRTVLTPPSAGGYIITYYRRKFFMPPVYPDALTLELRHVVDDGAIMYLNGQEVNRIRLPAGPMAWTNLADVSPEGAPLAANFHPVETTNNPMITPTTALIVNGDNAFAIENHQNAASSSDVVTGVELYAYITSFSGGPARITTDPVTNTVVTEGQGFTLQVAADGTMPLSFQWYHNHVAITNATNRIFMVTTAVPPNAGDYYFVAQNASSVATSLVAHVTVLGDFIPPQALSAVGSRWFVDGASNITLAFSEPIDPASTVPARFTLHGGGSNLVVHGAAVTNATSVILATDARLPGVDYTVAINGVTDTSYSKNSCFTNLPVVAQFDIIQINDTNHLWSYDDSGVDRTSLWYKTNFIGGWKTGRLAFDCKNDTTTNRTTVGGETVRTQLNLYYPPPWGITSNTPAFYFETTFSWPGTNSTATVLMNWLLDDGAIFYLNGFEFFATNMPATRPVTFATAAPSAPGTAVMTPPTTGLGQAIQLTNLVHGTNVLAVELHQNGSASSDATFGFNMLAVVPAWNPAPANPPVLHAELVGDQVRISWSPNAGTLMQSTNVTTGWTPVTGALNPYATTPSGHVFYKLSN